MLGSFVLCAIKSLIQGFLLLLNYNNPDFKVEFDVFSYAIPFASFVLDHSIKRIIIQQQSEKSVWVFFKLTLIIYYLGVYVMSLETKGSADSKRLSKFYVLGTINLIGFLIVNSIYSWALYKGLLN